jgi:hypothetical protein
MVLGNESTQWQSPALRYSTNKTTDNPRSFFGTILEYDSTGKELWHWKSLDYFKKSDIINYQPHAATNIIDVHENSFYFDEQSGIIYIGFKGISRIIKLKYPEGIVLNAYGEIFRPGIPEQGNGLFCQQHCVRSLPNGYITLFNNNSCDSSAYPQVELLKEPSFGKGPLKKVWEYNCTYKSAGSKQSLSGGYVKELPDNSLFVSMGHPYSKLFIINRDKKIIWSALPEKRDPIEKKMDHYLPIQVSYNL